MVGGVIGQSRASPNGQREAVIEYRKFHNSDPPHLLRLWESAGLGRGAAEGFTCDAFELLNFAQPYFDRDGLIVACHDRAPIGFVHCGFGSSDDGSGLDFRKGVICLLLVDPVARRRGIGRELFARAVDYLKSKGAESIHFGGSPGRNPFYVGLYGGSQPAGLLESDPLAAPFAAAVGCRPVARHAVFSRDLGSTRDAMNFRIAQNRRKYELRILGQPDFPTWWWMTRFGRLDSLRFVLTPKGGGPPAAAVTVVGLDLYIARWNHRAVGLTDLYVPERLRRQGFAQTLVVEVCRRLRDELINIVEMHAPLDNEAINSTLKSCNFQQVDLGVVYGYEGV